MKNTFQQRDFSEASVKQVVSCMSLKIQLTHKFIYITQMMMVGNIAVE